MLHNAVTSTVRILVVDDNQDGADSIGLLLRSLGHEVAVCYSGSAGLQMAQTFLPHVALIDIAMPHMDGYQLVSLLREIPELQQTILVALTGYGLEEYRERARRAGFHYYLLKPADFSLLAAICAMNDVHSQAVQRETQPNHAAPPSLKQSSLQMQGC